MTAPDVAALEKALRAEIEIDDARLVSRMDEVAAALAPRLREVGWRPEPDNQWHSNHPSEVPVGRILHALGSRRPLLGLWVQFEGDGTERARFSGTKIVVSVQFGHPGAAFAEEGRGASVKEASKALLAVLDEAEKSPEVET